MQNQVKFSAETKKLLQRDNNKIKILVRAIFHQNVSLNYILIYYMLRYHKHCKTTEKCTHIYQTVCTQAGYEQTCSQVRSSTPISILHKFTSLHQVPSQTCYPETVCHNTPETSCYPTRSQKCSKVKKSVPVQVKCFSELY